MLGYATTGLILRRQRTAQVHSEDVVMIQPLSVRSRIISSCSHKSRHGASTCEPLERLRITLRSLTTSRSGLARLCTLQSWLSQWSIDKVRGDGLVCGACISAPLLEIVSSSDDAVSQQHTKPLFDAAMTKDKRGRSSRAQPTATPTSRIAGFKLAKRHESIETLPKNSGGEVLKGELQQTRHSLTHALTRHFQSWSN